MKKITAGLLAVATMLATPFSAQADDWSRRHDRHAHRDYGRFGPPHVRPHRHGPPPWAWGAAGITLGGVVIGLEAARPGPIFAAPPDRPPGRMWYYCDAYGAYYPQIQYCPGGWRALP